MYRKTSHRGINTLVFKLCFHLDIDIRMSFTIIIPMKRAVSFSFNEHFPKGEMLETRIKLAGLTLVLGRGFIFVQYSHKKAA